MRFSLVIATLGRVDEVEMLLRSLEQQTFRDFEVILVDQNTDGRLSDLKSTFDRRFERCIWIQSDIRGANVSRNKGLAVATGEVTSFVDDDCAYPPDTLATVDALLRSHPDIAVFTGRARDRQTGADTMSIWPVTAQPVGPRNVLNLSLEFTTYFRREALVDEQFDPRFGPGTRFGSREGPDLMLRMMYRGFAVRYDPAIFLYHPDKFTSYDDPAYLERTRKYELGFGALVAKHVRLRQSLPVILTLLSNSMLFPVVGIAKNILLMRRKKLRFWLIMWSSRVSGYRDFSRQDTE